ATDARYGVERRVGDDLRDQRQVRLGGGPRVHRDVAAGLADPVEGRTVHHQVPDHGERRGAPRLDDDRGAVAELPHVQLARGGRLLGAVRDAVDDDTA